MARAMRFSFRRCSNHCVNQLPSAKCSPTTRGRPTSGTDTQVYPTADYDNFEGALDALYSEEVVQRHPPQSAALAVAGPVINNCCKMTNLGWVINGQELTQHHGIL